MRIVDSSSLRQLDKNRKSNSSMNRIMNSLFADELSQHEEKIDQYQEDIETLRSNIEKAGNLLTSEPTIENLQSFRDLLSRIAKRVSAEAYRLDKVGGTPQNPHYHEIITVINREADQLYHLIVKENKDNIAITAKIIGIKGLVVDLIT